MSYSVGHVFTFTGQRSVFVAFICYMHVIQGEKSVPLSLSLTMRGAQRLNDKRGIVGTVMLWSLWVYVLWQGYREKHGSLGSFYIDSSLTRTAVLCRNNNSIHHLTGHLYRQGRSAVQDSFARANYVCMQLEQCMLVTSNMFRGWLKYGQTTRVFYSKDFLQYGRKLMWFIGSIFYQDWAIKKKWLIRYLWRLHVAWLCSS